MRRRKKRVIPVPGAEAVEPIPLEAFRERNPGFVPPRSYAAVRESSALRDILDTAKPAGKPVRVDRGKTRPEDVCCN